jgi:hypothetical protein
MESDIEIGRDGNQVTAVRHGFRDLQQDHCGFGDTEEEAIADLLAVEKFPRLSRK